MSICVHALNNRRRPQMEIKMNNNGKRVVVITGATSGIGRAVANRFAAASDHVIAIGRKTAELKNVAAQTGALGAQAETMAVDITNETDLDNLFQQAIARAGRL